MASVTVDSAGESVTVQYGDKPTPGLWFTVPQVPSARKVFAHYFGPYPRSLNNSATEATDTYQTAFNNPTGITGHTDERGWFRDAPLWRVQQPGDWMYSDAVFDIQTAQAAGIDGFVVDMLGLSGTNYDNYARLALAASNLGTGFFVVPMVDANGGTGAALPADAARAIATFAGKKSSYYLPDGRFVVSSFRMEGKPIDWWTQTFAAVKAIIGVDVAFLSAALNSNANSSYASITYGEGVWGYGADPITIAAASAQGAAAHLRGKAWMAPIECQDIRPAAGLFDESGNTESTRAAWDRAINEAAEYVQIVTWSDFSEGTTIVPSKTRGYATLDLCAWYAAKFHTGAFPPILTDAVILSHRSNSVTSTPTPTQVKVMTQWNRGAARTNARDTVEALTFLTAPADVSVVIGGVTQTYTAPAGMSAKLFPLVVGSPPSITISRSGITVAQVSSTVTIIAVPMRDDKSYFWFSSARGTAGQKAPYGP